MPIYTLHRTQTIPTSLATAWEFFSSPQNLARLTPGHLGFQIIGSLPETMYPGLVIEYRVRPLLGLPMSWLTEITHVKPLEYFVDEQRHGPYRIWHHEHFFKEIRPGVVEMRDKITYQPPFGFIGGLVHPILIRPQLEKIFAYRHQAVEEIFGKPSLPSPE